MRLTFIISGFITAIIGLGLSILPFGAIAIIPIALSLVLGLLAWRWSMKESKPLMAIKGLFLIVIVSLGLTIYNSLRPNEIVEDPESTPQESPSEEVPMDELDAIDIED